jgi:hypothetical protein
MPLTSAACTRLVPGDGAEEIESWPPLFTELPSPGWTGDLFDALCKEDTMEKKKEEYRTPELIKHGTVEELTQTGAEPGGTDLGNYASAPDAMKQ